MQQKLRCYKNFMFKTNHYRIPIVQRQQQKTFIFSSSKYRHRQTNLFRSNFSHLISNFNNIFPFYLISAPFHIPHVFTFVCFDPFTWKNSLKLKNGQNFFSFVLREVGRRTMKMKQKRHRIPKSKRINQ